MFFPICSECHCTSVGLYHAKCSEGGHSQLRIDPVTEIVSCPDCGKSWYIYRNYYITKCGHLVQDEYLSKFSKKIVLLSKQIDEAEMKKLSDYVKEQDQTKAIIKKYDRKSKEEFFNKFCIYVQKLMRGIIENLGAELIIKISRIVLASFGIII